MKLQQGHGSLIVSLHVTFVDHRMVLGSIGIFRQKIKNSHQHQHHRQTDNPHHTHYFHGKPHFVSPQIFLRTIGFRTDADMHRPIFLLNTNLRTHKINVRDYIAWYSSMVHDTNESQHSVSTWTETHR